MFLLRRDVPILFLSSTCFLDMSSNSLIIPPFEIQPLWKKYLPPPSSISLIDRNIEYNWSWDQSLVSINQGLITTRLIIINVPKFTN